jgi:Zn-dependent peptidase ImmA (M78 family)/DNA-binding XRE family transcriptional regulator
MKNDEVETGNEGFRPDLLSLRRRMVGLSQAELAELVGISQAAQSRIEQGLKEVTTELVKGFATALSCAVDFFFQPEREYGPPMSAHPMYRKRASVGAKVLDKAIAEYNVRIAHTRALLKGFELEPELPMPLYDAEDFEGNLERAADLVRRAWYLPAGPVRSVTECLERAGCIVMSCDMAEAKIDAATYSVAGMPPMIFVNQALPGDRLRFTLAHELAHLVLHRYPTPEMEKEADAFASAFLMPARDIGPELDGLTLAKASYMKPVWKVSIAALVYRATELKRIDRSKGEWLWRTLSAKGWRLKEPASLDIPKETPSISKALFSDDWTPAELSKMLHLPYEELDRLYGLGTAKPGLRRVK